MATEPDYDAALTSRIQAELDGMGGPLPEERSRVGVLIGRLEGDFRSLISEPTRREKTLAFLRGPAAAGVRPTTASSGPSAGPLRGALNQMVSLSTRLDQSTDPAEGFSLAESVAQQVHEISNIVEGFLPSLDPADAMAGGFHRLVALMSQLIRNAVAKMRTFANLLGVSSFSVTFYTTPPQVSVTFNFDIPGNRA
ncbi:MAG: hypothetical protein L3K14_04515 [Thermoplasmata archaeon]|nr:hypothetical protein [Thermoplasmata archaeon]